LALAPGTRVGVYDITAQIGEGGIEAGVSGDPKLKRWIAIKILSPPLAADSERLRVFNARPKSSLR